MIIDDLTPTLSDNFSDEIPVEQGTATLKTTWQKGLNLFVSSAGTPLMDGTASTGSANALSRSDHIHPTDTSRASQTDMTAVQTTIGTTALPTTAQTITGAIDEIYNNEKNEILYFTAVTCWTTTGGDFIDFINSKITADHVLVECVFDNPSVIVTDGAWSTTNGRLKVNGTCTTTTYVSLVLVKKDN